MKLKSVAGVLLMGGVLLSCFAGSNQAQPAKTIEITAQRFAFEPGEITLKKGQEVTLVIRSKDISHGLLIEDLGVRTDIKTGESTEVKFTPDAAGTFEGKCAHFCGKGHGSMTLIVHVVE
jgi:cytochrome c oxidase subunit II